MSDPTSPVDPNTGVPAPLAPPTGELPAPAAAPDVAPAPAPEAPPGPSQTFHVGQIVRFEQTDARISHDQVGAVVELDEAGFPRVAWFAPGVSGVIHEGLTVLG